MATGVDTQQQQFEAERDQVGPGQVRLRFSTVRFCSAMAVSPGEARTEPRRPALAAAEPRRADQTDLVLAVARVRFTVVSEHVPSSRCWSRRAHA